MVKIQQSNAKNLTKWLKRIQTQESQAQIFIYDNMLLLIFHDHDDSESNFDFSLLSFA
jgi:hypothetical protein